MKFVMAASRSTSIFRVGVWTRPTFKVLSLIHIYTACPVCSVNMDSCTGKEATPEEPAEQEQPQNGMGGLLIFLVVGLLGGGAALYYVKFMKPKQNVKGSTDLDEFDFDEYDEDEPEEADSADTEQEDEEE